jgi:hypothetical protein
MQYIKNSMRPPAITKKTSEVTIRINEDNNKWDTIEEQT